MVRARERQAPAPFPRVPGYDPRRDLSGAGRGTVAGRTRPWHHRPVTSGPDEPQRLPTSRCCAACATAWSASTRSRWTSRPSRAACTILRRRVFAGGGPRRCVVVGIVDAAELADRFGLGRAMRALKLRLSDVVYRQMAIDAKRLETGPGGHVGATLQSSAADLIPMIDTSDKSLPGPANAQPRTRLLAAS